MSPTEQAAVNRFLAGREGFTVREIATGGKWCLWHPTGYRLNRYSYSRVDIAWNQADNYFSDYNALHRVLGMLSPEQWAVYTKEICKVFEDRALVNIMNASIRSGEFPDVAATYATVAGAMMVPCSTCAPLLARVLGYVGKEV